VNAVIVDSDLASPPTSGKRIRTLSLMLRLARRHRLTYLCRGNGDVDEARRAELFLSDHGIETLIVHHPLQRKSGPRFYARLAANLLSPLPYSVAAHHSPEILQAIARHAARHAVDLWQFEWMPYAEALREFPGARTVLNAQNVDSLIYRRYAQNEKRPLRKWFFRQQAAKMERLEGRALPRFDRVVAVSNDDAELARKQYGLGNVCVVENGVDPAHFAEAAGEREPSRVLFLGALDYRPNLDAVGLLLDSVWPRVRAGEPAARLCIVGRNPPAALAARVAAQPGVELHADVPDVRPYLGTCGIMAVPLRAGGGSRLKILEALAAGLPVVSTRIGAEGLELTPGRHLVVVEDVAGMAGALLECLRAPGRAREMAECGRQEVRARYDWDVLAGKLERVWEECVRGPAPEEGAAAEALGVVGGSPT
jgi:glycosyltransferase involved in cell wall biosynthesis